MTKRDDRDEPLSFKNRPQLVMIVLRDRRLSMTARVVAAELLDHRNPTTGRCNPAIKRLAGRVGRSGRAVSDAIQELEGVGYITSKRRRGTMAFTFHVEAFKVAKAAQKAADQAKEDRQDSADHEAQEDRQDSADHSDTRSAGFRRSHRQDSADPEPPKRNHQRGTTKGEPMSGAAASSLGAARERSPLRPEVLLLMTDDLKIELKEMVAADWPCLGTKPSWHGIRELVEMLAAEGPRFRRYLLGAVWEVAYRTQGDEAPATLKYAVKRVEEVRATYWANAKPGYEAEAAAEPVPAPDLADLMTEDEIGSADRDRLAAQIDLIERWLARIEATGGIRTADQSKWVHRAQEIAAAVGVELADRGSGRGAEGNVIIMGPARQLAHRAAALCRDAAMISEPEPEPAPAPEVELTEPKRFVLDAIEGIAAWEGFGRRSRDWGGIQRISFHRRWDGDEAVAALIREYALRSSRTRDCGGFARYIDRNIRQWKRAVADQPAAAEAAAHPEQQGADR